MEYASGGKKIFNSSFVGDQKYGKYIFVYKKKKQNKTAMLTSESWTVPWLFSFGLLPHTVPKQNLMGQFFLCLHSVYA